MAARQASVSTPLFGENISKLWPISYEGQSDTACFDNALEFLTQGGYSLAHAVMMLIPEAWASNKVMDEERKAFYQYHAALMEPWDGPAAVVFTDGRQIGATLDRNGLRPARYLVTDDDRIVLASEAGVLPVDEANIVQKWRLQPGKMLLIDFDKGGIVSDAEVKHELISQNPYQEWLARTRIVLEDMPVSMRQPVEIHSPLLDLQQAFGYTQEDLKLLMSPMATTGQEAIGSMGTDTPISVLSAKTKLLYTYRGGDPPYIRRLCDGQNDIQDIGEVNGDHHPPKPMLQASFGDQNTTQHSTNYQGSDPNYSFDKAHFFCR